ncbi:VanZ family protein [Lactiplantibacillus pentosus]|nr:VanZ family protein [Lactiplantibacillus pentosus]
MSQHWLINRSSDINDVIANTLGILIGAVIAMIVHAVSLRKGRLATNQ